MTEQVSETTDPIPRYAQLDVFMALNGSDRSEEYTPFREKHGFAETWARLCSSVRDQVARNDDLVNIVTALNQDAFELQGDLDRAEQKLAEQAAIRIAALEEAAVIAAAGGSCWDMKLVQYRHLFPAEIAAAIRAAKEPTP